jgi:hypothetical protein
MYLTAALAVFLIVGLFWHRHRINQLEQDIRNLSNRTSDRLFLHAEYMGLLKREVIEEENHEMYPEWSYLEKQAMQKLKDNNYWHNGRYWTPRG